MLKISLVLAHKTSLLFGKIFLACMKIFFGETSVSLILPAKIETILGHLFVRIFDNCLICFTVNTAVIFNLILFE